MADAPPPTSGFDEARTHRIPGELDAVTHAELAQDVGSMALHGLEGDV